MGNFASQSLPIDDSVDILILGQTRLYEYDISFLTDRDLAPHLLTSLIRSRIGRTTALPSMGRTESIIMILRRPVSSAVMIDSAPLSDIALPPVLQPTAPPVNGSFGIGTFYMQKDGKTGVLALGSFSGADYDTMMSGLLQGLLSLKSLGATQLIVDVVRGPLINTNTY